jgi:hypothetical protein
MYRVYYGETELLTGITYRYDNNSGRARITHVLIFY